MNYYLLPHNRIISSIGLCLISLLSIQSCSNDTENKIEKSEEETTELAVARRTEPIVKDLDKIKKDDTIKVILANAPESYFINKGEPMGFEYELAERFADEIGLHIKVILAKGIHESIEFLNSGKGDVIATALTVTEERKQFLDFSKRIYSTHQVLVQKKPDNWRRMNLDNINRRLIRDVLDLEGDTIHLVEESNYIDRVRHLSSEIGAPIVIEETADSISADDLMKMVSEGSIKLTVADENIARLGQIFHDNLDVSTPISFSQQIAWAVRKESPLLVDAINNWIKEIKKSGLRNILYHKYFGENRYVEQRLISPYTTIKGKQLSPYDDLIKKYAETIDWDWKLLAAQAFKESRFDPNAKSWVGAKGLLQLLPRTAAAYGIHNLTDPEQSLKAGTKHNLWLNDIFKDEIADPLERKKFILGAYNTGHGHVQDAQRLAEKYGKDPQNWEDVAEFLLKKSNSNYYNDPVVKYGYCRGIEPVNYVERIFEIYRLYNDVIEA